MLVQIKTANLGYREDGELAQVRGISTVKILEMIRTCKTIWRSSMRNAKIAFLVQTRGVCLQRAQTPFYHSKTKPLMWVLDLLILTNLSTYINEYLPTFIFCNTTMSKWD